MDRSALLGALRGLSPAARLRSLLAMAAMERGENERVASSPRLADYLARIGAAADAALASPLPELSFDLYRRFDETGDRLGYEAPYFERRRRLCALALAVWLRGRPDHAAALADIAWAVCDEFTWCLPAHLGGLSLDPASLTEHRKFLDLFSCETAFALAEIRALLDGAVPPPVAERMRREVEERVLLPFLERKDAWPWELMENNWCAVCAGSIGAAALYLVDDEERLAAILGRVLPTLGRFMESFAEDGACLEGLGYWTYGVGFFLSFSDLLRQATGGRIDLSANAKFARVAAFQAKAYLDRDLALPFADAEPGERYRIGLSSFLERAFPGAGSPPPERAASFDDDRNGRFCLCLRDLLWSGSGEAGRPRPPAGPSWLPDAQWLLCPARGPGLPAFAAKGGHNGEPHNHNDVGSFLLALGPLQFLADIGRGEYTRDYFGEGRYGIFCASSLGHSLPVVDGEGQAAGEDRRAREVRFAEEEGRVALSMDISGAYALPGLLRLARSFEYDGRERLLVSDEYAFAGKTHRVVERFITAIPPSAIRVDAERGTCELSAEGACLEISCSEPGAAPLVSTHAHRGHAGEELEVACIDYAFAPGSEEFAVRFEFRFRPPA